jgi:hypothetical protein
MPSADTAIMAKLIRALIRTKKKTAGHFDRSTKGTKWRDEEAVAKSIQTGFLDSASALPWGRQMVGMTVRECENE